MRLWLVDPRQMCDQHLLGEHVECHMFVGTLNLGGKVEGYLQNNLLEPESLHARHDELAAEMVRRGMNHQSSLPEIRSPRPAEFWHHKIDREAARTELLRRCTACRQRGAS